MSTITTDVASIQPAPHVWLRGARWFVDVIMWFLVLLAVAVLSIAVLVPRVAGATPYNVATGSMAPALPAGTLIVVKPTAFDDIRIGDVVTFQVRSGDPTVATHRVSAIGSDLSGGKYLRTKGDANSAVDAELVKPIQVRGTVWYAVPKLGYVSNLLTGEQRQLAVYAVAVSLLVFAMYMFGGAARDRVVQRRQSQEGPELSI